MDESGKLYESAMRYYDQEETRILALLFACSIVGGQSKLAEIIGVTAACVNNWINRRDRIKLKHAYAIVCTCKGAITLESLCPEEAFIHYTAKKQALPAYHVPLTMIKLPPLSYIRLLIKYYRQLQGIPPPIHSQAPVIIDEYYRLLAFFDRLQAYWKAGQTTIPVIVISIEQHLQHISPMTKIIDLCTISERAITGKIIQKYIKHQRGRPENNHKICPKSDTIITRSDTRIAKVLTLGGKSTYRSAQTVATMGTADLIQAMDTKDLAISLAARIAKYPPERQNDLLKYDRKMLCQHLATLGNPIVDQSSSTTKPQTTKTLPSPHQISPKYMIY